MNFQSWDDGTSQTPLKFRYSFLPKDLHDKPDHQIVMLYDSFEIWEWSLVGES